MYRDIKLSYVRGDRVSQMSKDIVLKYGWYDSVATNIDLRSFLECFEYKIIGHLKIEQLQEWLISIFHFTDAPMNVDPIWHVLQLLHMYSEGN